MRRTARAGTAWVMLCLAGVLVLAGCAGSRMGRMAARGDAAGIERALASGVQPDTPDRRGRTPLEIAVRGRRSAVVRALVDAGADPSRPGSDGLAPVHLAARGSGSPVVLQLLLDAGADPDLPDHAGEPPLAHAIAAGSVARVELLLRHGADPGVWISGRGTDLLHLAWRSGRPRVVTLLVAAGADPDRRDRSGRTVRMLSRGDPHMVAAIAHGMELRKEATGSYARPVPMGPAGGSSATRPAAGRPGGAGPIVLETASPAAGASGSAELPAVDWGRYHALVIGNDAYQSLPPLRTAVHDARAVSLLLRERYGFTVTQLENATRAEILQALGDYRRTLGPGDNLLIYYAGHGWLDEEADRGYWLPVDASADSEIHWIANETVTAATRAMQAKHVMVIADSCYSGRLTRGLLIPRRSPGYLEKLADRRARVVLTSGGLEPVLDAGGRDGHSVFAAALLRALEQNAGVLEGHQLFDRIRRPVMLDSDQVPEYADIRKAGHDGGDFLFVRR